MEVERLALQVVAGAADAAQALVRRQVQQQRQVGHQAARRDRVRGVHLGTLDAAAVVLVGNRRVEVAVAEHERAALERRADHLRHELRARRGEHQQLGARVGRFAGGRTQQRLAQPLAEARAAGLAAGHDLAAGLAGAACEGGQQRRLTRALAALDRNEAASLRFAHRQSGSTGEPPRGQGGAAPVPGPGATRTRR